MKFHDIPKYFLIVYDLFIRRRGGDNFGPKPEDGVHRSRKGVLLHLI